MEKFYNTSYLPLEEEYDEDLVNKSLEEKYIKNNEENLKKLYLIEHLEKKSIEASFVIKSANKIVQEYDFTTVNNLSNKNLSEIESFPNSLTSNKNYNNKNETIVDYDYTVPRWPLAIFYIGGMICLGFSATFHLFSAHSKIVKRVFNRMDYGGIAVLIVCSCYPPYYYYFYCNFSKKYNLYLLDYAIGYIIFMTVYGLTVFGITMSNHFDRPKYQKIKGILFLCLGISAGIAILHMSLSP